MRKTIIVAVVALVALFGFGSATAHDPADDIAVRDELIQAQEDLLNVYRCMFDIDTELVPGGCVDGAPAPPADDSAWYVAGTFWQGNNLYVSVEDAPAGFCVLDLTLDGEPIDRWATEWSPGGETVLFKFFILTAFGIPDFDGFALDCDDGSYEDMGDGEEPSMAITDFYWADGYLYVVVDNTPPGYCELTFTRYGTAIADYASHSSDSGGERTFEFELAAIDDPAAYEPQDVYCE